LVVKVRYFAAAAEVTNRAEEIVAMPAGSTLGELKDVLVQRYGQPMEKILGVSAYLINPEINPELTRDLSVAVGTHVDVLPPFAGG
jgi:molybdopterin converting factor small subunit